MELRGFIKNIGLIRTYGDNSFRKRELVINTDEQYPQTIMIEFVQDKCSLLEDYEINQNVCISINLRGREWINPQGEAKYFNSVQGWKIESINNTEKLANQAITDLTQCEPDDLPF
ncbi:conserved protein of unknown function [Tenacibaculum sp. 190524A02b]|uniref:DUF3127 domain-containing protein n=1 Tax=Tenacibaculum vairaonense TaxID=3137860 RepID=UPI0032B1318C